MIVGVAGAVLHTGSDSTNDDSTDTLQCPPSDPRCAAQTVRDLLSTGAVTAAVSELERIPIDAVGCHDLAHDVGRAAGRLPWAEALGLNTSTLDLRCDYGYIHGVFQGLADSGTDIAQVAQVGCAPDGTEAGEECYHAAGHGIAISTSTVPAALRSCAQIDYVDGAVSCASGVFMEHATSFIAAARGTGASTQHVAPLDAGAAARLCLDVDPVWVLPCARKAALFWSTADAGPGALATQCIALAETRRVERGDVLLECGAGIGEWLRNIEGWEVPVSAAEAAALDAEVAGACGAIPGVGRLRHGCIEGVVTLILPGQVLSGTPRESWIAPCIPPLDETTVRACRQLVDAITEQLSTPS